MALIAGYLFLYLVVALNAVRALESKEGKYASTFRLVLYASTTAAFLILAFCCVFGNGWDTSNTLDASKVTNPKGTIVGVVVNFFILIGPYGVGLFCLAMAFGQYNSLIEEKTKLSTLKVNSDGKKSA